MATDDFPAASSSSPISSPPPSEYSTVNDIEDRENNIPTTTRKTQIKFPNAPPESGLPAYIPQPPTTASAKRAALSWEKNHGLPRPPFMTPPNKRSCLRADLRGFGFKEAEVKELLGREDGEWHPTVPKFVPDAEKEGKGRSPSRGRAVTRARKEGGAWVPFDPLAGFPTHFGPPPPFLDAYTNNTPGGKRILQYHTGSGAVRLKSTPSALRGKAVSHAATDASLVQAKRGSGRARRVPARLAPAAKPTERVKGAKVEKKVAATKTGRPRGRPRKVPRVASEESEIAVAEGSDSSLTDLELEEEEDVAVKVEGERGED